MSVKISPIYVGFGCCYVIKDKGTIMWENLLNNGSRTVFPAHGEPFSTEILKEAIL